MKARTELIFEVGRDIRKATKLTVLYSLTMLLFFIGALASVCSIVNMLISCIQLVLKISILVIPLFKTWQFFVAPVLLLCVYFTVWKVVRRTTSKSVGWLATSIHCGFLLALCGYVMAMID